MVGVWPGAREADKVAEKQLQTSKKRKLGHDNDASVAKLEWGSSTTSVTERRIAARGTVTSIFLHTQKISF